jgi:hypothetical protein
MPLPRFVIPVRRELEMCHNIFTNGLSRKNCQRALQVDWRVKCRLAVTDIIFITIF